MNLDTISQFEDTTSVGGAIKSVLKAAGGTDTSSMKMVPFEQVHIIPGFNIRDDSPEYEAHLQNIEAQMDRDGWRITEPAEGIVLDGKICLVGAHTRYKAAERARAKGKDIPAVPMVMHPQGTTMEQITDRLLLGNSGMAVSTLGQAAVVGRKSRQFGRTEEEIAESLGFTKKYVGQLLKLDNSPMELKRMISAGTVSASLVITKLLEMKDGAAVLNFFKAHLEAQKPADGEGGEGGEGTSTENKAKITAKGIRTSAEKVAAQQKKDAALMFQYVDDLTASWDRMQKLIADDPDVAEGYNQLLTLPDFKTEADKMEEVIDKITVIQARVEALNQD